MQHLQDSGRSAVLGALLLALALGGCGEPEDPGSGGGLTDAGVPDAGAPDAGEPDAGIPDAGPGPDAEIALRLAAIPGMTVTERASTEPGYRFFRLTYEQPVDHAHPEGQRFEQRLTLMHGTAGAPMVLNTTGYSVHTNPRLEELPRVLGAHQLSVEHRYFEASRPQPTDWKHLNIRQAAADFHRIVEAIKPLYPVKWLSTGVSKGAETVVFHRRFYPDDVDGTVAYSAPLVQEDDARFPPFVQAVGGDTYADCRERLKAFQRRMLGERRAEMRQELQARAERYRWAYTRLGYDMALEHATLESSFGFWQGMDPTLGCDWIPGEAQDAVDHLNFLDLATYLKAFSDAEMAVYEPYFYQAATELGSPRFWEEALDGLLLYPGTDKPQRYAPAGVELTFDPSAMQDIQQWVATEGQRLLFLYGEFDPWSAAAYSLGDARDSYLYVAPGLHHGVRLANLPEPTQSEALDIIRGWAGLEGLHSVQRTRPPMLDDAAPEDLGPRRRALP
jgi:PS-10 peptidase S37